MTPDAMDFINALFEYGGAIAVVPSIVAIRRDRRVHGISMLTPLFFAAWGWWNLLYYPHLDQTMSTIGAVFLASANSMYLYLVIKYRRKSAADDYVIRMTQVARSVK